MRIAITGAGGLIGKALGSQLEIDGHEVVRIGRYNERNPPDVRWSVPHAQLSPEPLEGLDAVVHLAGEPVFGRWTDQKKRAIHDSRSDGTELLARTLAGLYRKPAVLISASAIGYYGDRGDDVLTESSDAGGGFLAEVATAWESATAPASEADIRVVQTRFGVVMAEAGGALAQMLPFFKLGLGGPLGNGAHWVSWISLDDTLGAILHLLGDGTTRGPVNVVAPTPVTNREFTRVLSSVLKRPAFFPVPRFAMRQTYGELADEVLLASQRVEPKVLAESGYDFKHPTLEAALRAELADD